MEFFEAVTIQIYIENDTFYDEIVVTFEYFYKMDNITSLGPLSLGTREKNSQWMGPKYIIATYSTDIGSEGQM